jgi:hypothetical protein
MLLNRMPQGLKLCISVLEGSLVCKVKLEAWHQFVGAGIRIKLSN